jgi:hypothetical protein
MKVEKVEKGGARGRKRIFLYLFRHDFRKINGRIKIFEKCTSGAAPYGGRRSCRRGARH